MQVICFVTMHLVVNGVKLNDSFYRCFDILSGKAI